MAIKSDYPFRCLMGFDSIQGLGGNFAQVATNSKPVALEVMAFVVRCQGLRNFAAFPGGVFSGLKWNRDEGMIQQGWVEKPVSLEYGE